jgi:hypothetical protein
MAFLYIFSDFKVHVKVLLITVSFVEKYDIIERPDQGHLSDPLHRRRELYLKSFLDSL